MNSDSKSQGLLWLALIAVGLIAITALFFAASKPVASPSYGGVTNYDEVDATAIKIGGSTGTRVGPIIVGAGSLISANYSSLAASTSLAADIAVPGVVSGDYVFAQFATSTAVSAGWLVTGASASSTSGFITVRYVNNTGAVATIPASIASTTQYQVYHPRSTVPGL